VTRTSSAMALVLAPIFLLTGFADSWRNALVVAFVGWLLIIAVWWVERRKA
jgi:hypothetical protein